MKSFQVDRIKSFFDPSLDPKNKSWQVDQSMIAIGSGGMHGKGWRGGTETMLGYLPKNTSYNDLIFPVVGEAFGFLGAAALIIGEGTVLLWCLWVAARARDKIGALVAVGVMTMLFTHIFVNIGMTIQLVPITGIPLPFVSYGGTFLVACLAAMGLVQSVWVHRKNFERI
jgi:rod shape determining protein RodA